MTIFNEVTWHTGKRLPTMMHRPGKHCLTCQPQSFQTFKPSLQTLLVGRKSLLKHHIYVQVIELAINSTGLLFESWLICIQHVPHSVSLLVHAWSWCLIKDILYWFTAGQTAEIARRPLRAAETPMQYKR